jgi:hypothetical protein
MRAFLLSVLLALPCFAQGVTGTVTDSGTRAPLRGAVVTLIDSSGRRMGIAAVGEDGTFRLAAPAAGSYRVRAQRIGYRPSERGVQLGADYRQVDISLRALGQLLDTIRVARAANCIRSDGTSAFAAWQQLQASVASVAATQRRAINARIIRQLVVYDRSGRVQRREANVYGGYARSPWDSPSLDSLVRQGFVVAGVDGSTTYHAPDLDAMLSDDFARTFCLRLATSRDPSLIGISFQPNAEVKTPSIGGTFWLERRSSRLTRMEFRFTGISDAQRNAGAGGSLDFGQLSNGEWVIMRWSLTMPLIQERLDSESATIAAPTRRVAEAVATHVASGEVAFAALGSDTLYVVPPGTLYGVLRDESDKPIKDAVVSLEGEYRRMLRTDSTGIFRFDSVPPGFYSVVARDNANRDFAGVRFTMTSADLEVDLRGSPTRAQANEATFAAAAPPRPDGMVLLRGYVRDTSGLPVSQAQVSVRARSNLVADALGRFSTRVRPGEYEILVRRIGFQPVTHKVNARRDTVVNIVMHPSTVRLQDVNVTASTINGLSRDGFYDRMRDRQRGLLVGYFVTPEDIETRPVARTSQHFERFPGIRMQKSYTQDGKYIGMLPVTSGGCVMTMYLDGQRLKTDFEHGEPDLLISPSSVAAIELYPRGMMLPARFQALNGTCGVIAVWTKY